MIRDRGDVRLVGLPTFDRLRWFLADRGDGEARPGERPRRRQADAPPAPVTTATGRPDRLSSALIAILTGLA